MDPNLEKLHVEQQQRRRDAPSSRERATEVVAGLLLFAVSGAMWSLTPHAHMGSILVPVLAIVLYAVVWQVTFEVGAVATTPLQLVFVPMWFAVEPALLPVVVAAGQILGNIVSSLASKERHHWRRVWIGIPDAWYSVGPAIVLAAFSVHSPSLGQWPIYVLALGAQFVADSLATGVRTGTSAGVQASDTLNTMVWVVKVDIALAAVGLVVAIAMRESAWGLLTVIPIVALLHEFAKERDDRISKALELSHAYRGTAQLMGDVLEADDEYTGGEHTQGVVAMSTAVGLGLRLDATAMRDLEFGALLHDIGKLRVPNQIINKPGKLTDEEWVIMKKHPEWGQEMLERIGGMLADVGKIVRAHHERVDGKGYPDGLVGDAIPIAARVITACDSFSAMTTDRSYRKAMSIDEALTELEACSGTQFDPLVVGAFRRTFGAKEVGAQSELAAVKAAHIPPAPIGKPASSSSKLAA